MGDLNVRCCARYVGSDTGGRMVIAGQGAINVDSEDMRSMPRPHSFGGLRLHRAIMQNNKGAFKAFLLREGHKEEDLINIKKAFESLKTETPIGNETIFK